MMPIVPETLVEERIMADPEWIAGASWGVPRRGHPEGRVDAHVVEVLANVERVAVDRRDRERLRLIALVHDSLKHRVDRKRARAGENHHATLARRFAERYIDDLEVLDVIELDDEAYAAYVTGARRGRWPEAAERADALIVRLGPAIGLYLRFARADSETGDKRLEPLRWFEARVRGRS